MPQECRHSLDPSWSGCCTVGATNEVDSEPARGVNHGGETKQDLLDAICHLVGLPCMENSIDSSTPSDVPRAVGERFGVPYRSMPETAQAVTDLAGIEWDHTCDSRRAPSGGGSTVTAAWLCRLRRGVRTLIGQGL